MKKKAMKRELARLRWETSISEAVIALLIKQDDNELGDDGGGGIGYEVLREPHKDHKPKLKVAGDG